MKTEDGGPLKALFGEGGAEMPDLVRATLIKNALAIAAALRDTLGAIVYVTQGDSKDAQYLRGVAAGSHRNTQQCIEALTVRDIGTRLWWLDANPDKLHPKKRTGVLPPRVTEWIDEEGWEYRLRGEERQLIWCRAPDKRTWGEGDIQRGIGVVTRVGTGVDNQAPDQEEHQRPGAQHRRK
jgi:hypothetical protein